MNIWNHFRYQSEKKRGVPFSPMGRLKYLWRGTESKLLALFHLVPHEIQTLNRTTAKYLQSMYCLAFGPRESGRLYGKRPSKIYIRKVSLKSVYGSFLTTRAPSGSTRSLASAQILGAPNNRSVVALGFGKSGTYINMAANYSFQRTRYARR